MKERSGLYERTETFLFATHRKNNIHRKCKAVRKCQKAFEYGVSRHLQARGFGDFFTDKSFNLENPQKVS